MAKGTKAKKNKSQKAIKNAKLKQKKVEAVQQAGGDVEMDELRKVSKRPLQQKESSKDLFKRHAAERKQVQVLVADLKRQRAKIPKKGQKEEKKALTDKIRTAEAELRERQDADLKAAGLDRPAKQGRGCKSSSDDEVDDDAEL
mmetsp:Transcript_24893/g.54539  ORF Transcript_24893/g.54539 Transcript_24893/m.54539 type:complete len:144 (+) Transcript_24893:67-498(+)